MNLNPNYEVLEQILRLDIEAGQATAAQRKAQKQLDELAKRTKDIEERMNRLRTDMRLKEGDMLRKYRRLDELEELKTDRSGKLYAAKTDDEHRALKREVDNLEKEMRDTGRHCSEHEDSIERSKEALTREDDALKATLTASADERRKAEEAEQESAGKLNELQVVRTSYIQRLEDRVRQHYLRVQKVTRNPDGPITRIGNNACGNCHMGLAPQLMNSILLGRSIETCPSCHHILLPQNKA